MALSVMRDQEAFALIEPGAAGWSEVHVPARASHQPRLDLRMAVGVVVVADAMELQLRRHGLVDLAQEGEEFLVPMVRLARRKHRTVEHVQRRGQRSFACGAWSNFIF